MPHTPVSHGPTPTASAVTSEPSASTGTSQVQTGTFVFMSGREWEPSDNVASEHSCAINTLYCSVESGRTDCQWRCHPPHCSVEPAARSSCQLQATFVRGCQW